ncbi:unnamed protein product [marine sediment metagenome]|uniref:Uncharacterized protein n=1 Tax=marine sediment metagenome TaxID=412755 RepID=X1FG07_9ZZZZ
MRRFNTIFNYVSARSLGNTFQIISRSDKDSVYMIEIKRAMPLNMKTEVISVEFMSEEKYLQSHNSVSTASVKTTSVSTIVKETSIVKT